MDPRQTRTIVSMTDSDHELVLQSLAEFARYHHELAQTMNDLYVQGGNGLVTKDGAKHLADQHLFLATRGEILSERIAEDGQRLAFIQEP